jgi:AraC family transcriptional regulator, transcriptional activator of pobA
MNDHGGRMSKPAAIAGVPSYCLYGEPQRSIGEGFIHLESLDSRSRPGEWTIQSHVHRDLNHLIFISEGGGAMSAEDGKVSFEAPCLLMVPVGVVHGFVWQRESRGWVTTIAESYLRHLAARDADVASLFRRASVINLDVSERERMERTVEQIGIELGSVLPGGRAAVEAGLLSVVVLALRRSHPCRSSPIGSWRKADLVARLRERIERRFRLREPVAVYAKSLGTSMTALRQACASVAASSPAAMLDERTLLEAKRLLLYSSSSIGEISEAVGFNDPAYFSRFFARHAGRAPRLFRAIHGRDNMFVT